MALDRPTVLRAALDLLDEVGLDNLSLRRMATRLGVQAPALYWHFASKRELLDHMVGELFRQAEQDVPALPTPELPWDAWLAAHCRGRRRAMLAHRDGGRLVLGNRPTDDRMPDVEAVLRGLCDAGFRPADGLRGLLTAGNYTVGHVLEEQANDDRTDPEALPELTAGLPTLAAAINDGFGIDPDADFEFGLQLILEGLRAKLH